jgi:high-affinity nickel-transport protein
VADSEAWPTSFPPILDVWNAVVRLGFFLLVTWALATTRRALESQNELARRIQMGLLPSRLPADGSVEAAASWRPAQAVSGDFYFVDEDPTGAVVACIADVSGKGVGPALLMANVQAALETIVEAGVNPGALCARLNQFVTRHAAAGRYVTFFAMRLDARAGRLSYCNAGHNPPLLLRADGTVVPLNGGGPVLGVFQDREFEEREFAVAAMLILLGILNLTGTLRWLQERLTTSSQLPCAAGIFNDSSADTQLRDSDAPTKLESLEPKLWLDRMLQRVGLYNVLRPLAIGIVHGLAGSAAVALLVMTTIHDPWWTVSYLFLFGVGTIAGMMIITAAIAMPFAFTVRRFSGWSRGMAVASGLLSLGFGLFLSYQIGFVDGLFSSHPRWTPR